MALNDLIWDNYTPAGSGAVMVGTGTWIASIPEFNAKAVSIACYGFAAGMFLLARPEKGYIVAIRNYLKRRANGKT